MSFLLDFYEFAKNIILYRWMKHVNGFLTQIIPDSIHLTS